MKSWLKIIMGVAIALMLSSVFCTAAEARGRHHHDGGHDGGRIIIAPFYNPFYDPWYEPVYPYYPRYQPYYYPPPDYGYLQTAVEPNSAEVWVDGKFFGYAKDYDGPVHHLKLPLGEHEVRFVLNGYYPYTVNFTITPGDVTSIEYELVPASKSPPKNPAERYKEQQGKDEDDY